jgi:hypothetical protein
VSEPNALDKLGDALQGFVNEDEGEAAIISGSVVVYELVRFDDDGNEMRRICYTIPGPGSSLSGSLGLLDAGLHLVRRDALGDDSGDDL